MSPFSNTFLTWSDVVFLLEGLQRTCELAALSTLLGTLCGILLALLKAYSWPVARILLDGVTDVLRSVPLIIQFVLFNSGAAIAGVEITPFWCGIVVLSMYMAAYVSEVAKAGLTAVPSTMRRAARSLGITYMQDLFHVVLPISLRTVFPAWLGLVLGLLKDTSLVAVIGYIELLRATQILVNREQRPLLYMCLVGVIYFMICFTLSRLGARFERRRMFT